MNNTITMNELGIFSTIKKQIDAIAQLYNARVLNFIGQNGIHSYYRMKISGYDYYTVSIESDMIKMKLHYQFSYCNNVETANDVIEINWNALNLPSDELEKALHTIIKNRYEKCNKNEYSDG